MFNMASLTGHANMMMFTIENPIEKRRGSNPFSDTKEPLSGY